MPIGKLNEEDRQRLSDHFWAIVLKACVTNDCLPGEVLNSLKKSHGIKGITPARMEIVREIRQTAFTYYSGIDQCRLWLSGDQPRPIPTGTGAAKWKPAISVSFKLLARALGFDHSTLVLAQQRLKKLKKKDHA